MVSPGMSVGRERFSVDAEMTVVMMSLVTADIALAAPAAAYEVDQAHGRLPVNDTWTTEFGEKSTMTAAQHTSTLIE